MKGYMIHNAYIILLVVCILPSCISKTKNKVVKLNGKQHKISYSKIHPCENNNNAHYINTHLMFFKEGQLIKADSLQTCVVKMNGDTLQILLIGTGNAGNSILIKAFHDSYQSYIEFWSDYNEFNGKNKIVLPLNRTSLVLNKRSYTINDTIIGEFECNDKVHSVFFNGEIEIKSTGCFNSIVCKD